MEETKTILLPLLSTVFMIIFSGGATNKCGGADDESKVENAPSPEPANRTKLLQIPVTVSFTGSWSTRKLST